MSPNLPTPSAHTGVFCGSASTLLRGDRVIRRWNSFDFFVTLTSVVEVILTARSHEGVSLPRRESLSTATYAYPSRWKPSFAVVILGPCG